MQQNYCNINNLSQGSFSKILKQQTFFTHTKFAMTIQVIKHAFSPVQ